jgi:hypothetical protein
MALGFFGLGRRRQAFQELTSVLRLDPAHLPAQMHLRTLKLLPSCPKNLLPLMLMGVTKTNSGRSRPRTGRFQLPF